MGLTGPPHTLRKLRLLFSSSSDALSFRGAGTGGLGLAVEGPSEAKMSCKDNKDGSCSVEYIPFTLGEYDVNITFGGLPIPGEASEPAPAPLPAGGAHVGVKESKLLHVCFREPLQCSGARAGGSE